MIGTVAGLMGGLLAGGFAWVVLNRLLDAEDRPGCVADARLDRGHCDAGDRDGLAGQFPDAGPEAAGDFEGRMKLAALFLLRRLLMLASGWAAL